MNSGDFDSEHEMQKVSKVKLPCSFMESLLLDSRVGVSRLSMAQEFLLCKIIAGSGPLSRVVF